MKIKKIIRNNIEIAHIVADEIILTDFQSAVDLMMTANYKIGSKNIVLSKDLITDNFFILSSGLAGEVLQKFINYQFKVAIYGDFSKYTSKPLKDFIYECNNGYDIFFTNNFNEAIEKLTTAIRI